VRAIDLNPKSLVATAFLPHTCSVPTASPTDACPSANVSGKAAKEFRAQAVQAFENIKTALASGGGSMDNVVRLVTYLTDIEQNADAYREVRASFFPNKSALPASTLLQ
jgi:enamine deaminase RidA (YjgF/YER057c/UK114 family)